MAQRGGRWMRPRPDWGLAVDRTARGSPRGCNGDTSLAFRVWTPSGSLRRARNGTPAFEFTKGACGKVGFRMASIDNNDATVTMHCS